MQVIGAADEFWRLRMISVNTTQDLDFEWHEDILYRDPQVQHAEEIDLWRVEAVRLDDYEATVIVASFDDRDDAEAFYLRANEDLSDMTKNQFEEAYLGEPESGTSTAAS